MASKIQVRPVYCLLDIAYCQIPQECHDTLQLAVTAIGAADDKCRLEKEERMADMGKSLAMKIDVDFEWTIDRLADRIKVTLFDSGYFYGRKQRYKMFLSSNWCCNVNDVIVYLRICTGESDIGLQWPFERYVTMSISNRGISHVDRIITDRCTISKPSGSSQTSGAFTYSHAGICSSGLMKDCCVTVKCIIYDE